MNGDYFGGGSFWVMVIVYACVGFGIFIHSAVRWYARASVKWEILDAGVVKAVERSEVARPFVAAEGVTVPLCTTETVITFDHGKRVSLPGDYMKECKPGDTVFVRCNQLGTYRIEHISA